MPTREEISETNKKNHAKGYAHRKDAANARRRSRRNCKTEWYQENKEKILAGHKKFYENHKEEIRSSEREKMKQMRAAIIERYGGKCVCCGETQYEFLTLDHINGGGLKHRKEIGLGGSKILYWIIRNNFPASMQILCWNCNLSKGFYGYCPHQIGE